MTRGPGIARTLLPLGFSAAGVNCGVRRYRPDLGIIISDRPATAAGVFTTNAFAAAPVRYCKELLPAKTIRAIITNSGQANAATGTEGVRANRDVAFEVAKELTCLPREVLTASTGVIGHDLDLTKILPAISNLVLRADETAENFALAILTTDLVPKTVTTTIKLSGGVVRLTGICKGSGMIHPNMATMLGYLLTDAEIEPEKAQSYLKTAVDMSFNMISVDTDTSTNDSVFMMANGASAVAIASEEDELLFIEALNEMSIVLAQSIASDGEGASKLVEVNVFGGKNINIVRQAARKVTMSPLVKTAMHGEDPNWGRILAKLGEENVSAEELETMELKVQGHTLFNDCKPVPFDRDLIKSLLKTHKIRIDIDLGCGQATATAWGCDLSAQYVEINTEYS